MKKSIPFLSLFLSLCLQGQVRDYYPSYSDSWQQLRRLAYLVEKPTDFSPTKKYPLIVYIHGNGDKGPGTRASLENLVLGIKVCETCARYNPGLPTGLQGAVEKYKILVAAPVYNTNSFTPANITELMDSLVKLYPVDTKRILLSGFSMGGGAVLSAIQDARITGRLAAAIPIAPVGVGGSYAAVVATDLPVWGFVNSGDAEGNPGGYTDSNKIKAAINSINSLTPKIPAVLTIVKAPGHGGPDFVFAQQPPAAPGGWYFTNATGTVYDWLLSMDSDNPRVPPGYGSNTPVPPPAEKPVEVPVGVNPDFNIANGQVITTNTYTLDASASTGATEYYWEVNRTMAPWVGHVLQGGTLGGPRKTVTGLQNGTYTVRLTINKNVQSDLRSFTVAIGASQPKRLVSFDSTTGLITYDDGSTEKGTATYSAGTWVLKNAAGQVIQP